MNLQKELIEQKLDLVVNKLMNLDAPVFSEATLKEGDKAISKGVIARDFGIKEWDWPQGVGLYGIKKLSDFKKSNKYQDFFLNWYKSNIEFGLPSRNVNTSAPLLTMTDLFNVNESSKDLKVLEDLAVDWAKWLMTGLPRTQERGFQHVTTDIKDRYGVILNEEQLWIDTLVMMVLFLSKMGVKYNKKEWIEEAEYQVLIHIKYLYEKKNGLFHHGWSFNEKGNFGEVFWCRGNSWFTFGMMEFLENCKGHISKSVEEMILITYKAQVEALLKIQSSNGLWHTVLDDNSSYLETSGSAAIAGGILKGVRLGVLPSSYREHGLRAIKTILDNVDKDGTVLNVSGGTGIGRDKDHYKNIIIAPMAYGQSLTIVALAESLYHI